MSIVRTMTSREAKKQRVDMYHSLAGCRKCKMTLRVKVKSSTYLCPCRIRYRNPEKASPV